MEVVWQKEHQTMKIKHLRVHFFLYTDVKQGNASDCRAAVLLQQAEQLKALKA